MWHPWRFLEVAPLEAMEWEPAVTSKPGGRRALWVTNPDGSAKGGQGRATMARHKERSPAEMLRLQGAPADLLDECPLTIQGMKRVIANGVPLPMGRAIAQAVKRALA
jgi:site-specific DNA-cytosine methylase